MPFGFADRDVFPPGARGTAVEGAFFFPLPGDNGNHPKTTASSLTSCRLFTPSAPQSSSLSPHSQVSPIATLQMGKLRLRGEGGGSQSKVQGTWGSLRYFRGVHKTMSITLKRICFWSHSLMSGVCQRLSSPRRLTERVLVIPGL